ncbi:VOC family protein [Halomonas sp. I1]|uniref:VOC family protein n=1 Tax=Halomonas sp. I1 TaxID=393536 RepID=UPI0028DFC562|nr:VOC family protein [Halomonas sp. I1]MDT8895843.1 VOC family protein [Halomonas sp. I1]
MLETAIDIFNDGEQMMRLQRTGVILNTEHHDACVAFYRDVLALSVMFEKQDGDFRLTCLDFGGAYLMVETGGVARPEGKGVAENATKLRFNVADLEETLGTLRSRGIEASIERHDWGATINIFDPDGNRVGLREEDEFRRQAGAGHSRR